MATIAISTWALHRTIGVSYPDTPQDGRTTKAVHCKETTDLLDLPGELRKNGYARMELCHFHLPSRDAEYLTKFRKALQNSGVVLQTLLIDDGDLSHPDFADRDAAWIQGWIDISAALGAEAVRVIAGRHSWTEKSAATATEKLKELTSHAEILGVRVRIENWFDLLSKPSNVIEMLNRLEGRLGLCLDFGNWSGPTKYEDLAAIASRAETTHAKADFLDAETLDTEDYQKCIDILLGVNFTGPFVIVNGGKGDDEWEAISQQAEFISSATR